MEARRLTGAAAAAPRAAQDTGAAGLAATADWIAGRFAAWAIAAVVLPVALAGAYWGVKTLVELQQEARDLKGAAAHLARELDRVERSARHADEEHKAALAAAVRRGEDGRAALDRASHERHAEQGRELAELRGAVAKGRESMARVETQMEGVRGDLADIKAILTRPPAEPAPRTAARAIDRLPGGSWPNGR